MSFFLEVPSRLAGGLLYMLEQCANLLVACWMRQAIKQLQQLDDREPQDMGLSRCRIEAAAHRFDQPDAKHRPTQWPPLYRTVS